MPKRLNNQHTAKKRRKEKRKLLKRRGISRRRVKKSQVSTQPVSAIATAATKPPSQVQKIYKLLLTKGPENENERSSWIRSIVDVFGKTEAEARDIIFHAEYYNEKPTLFSGDIEKIAGLRRGLAWSLRDATKIKE